MIRTRISSIKDRDPYHSTSIRVSPFKSYHSIQGKFFGTPYSGSSDDCLSLLLKKITVSNCEHVFMYFDIPMYITLWVPAYYTFDQNVYFKIRRENQKISYERRAYESVDVRSPFWVLPHIGLRKPVLRDSQGYISNVSSDSFSN